MMDAQKSVLITGCSAGGIGDALAQAFHRKGLRVFASARNVSKIQHLKEKGLDIVELDVTSDGSVKKAMEEVSAATDGRLDILFNNAGHAYLSPVLDVDMKALHNQFEVNYFGVIRTIIAFSPLLLKTRGTIINLGSISSLGAPTASPYAASKASLEVLSNALRLEMAPFDVKVIHICSGIVKSNATANRPIQKLPDNSLYKPVESDIQKFHLGAKEMDRDEYAEHVVRNALKRNPEVLLYAGQGTFQIRILKVLIALISYQVVDWAVWGQLGFGKLRTLVRAERERGKAPVAMSTRAGTSAERMA